MVSAEIAFSFFLFCGVVTTRFSCFIFVLASYAISRPVIVFELNAVNDFSALSAF